MSELITVIIPVYNVERYIKGCVDSVLCQTYKNLEIILVDDGSTDLSGRICDEYKALDERVNVIHKQNGGLSSARNAGLDASTGEYIFYIDSDDRIHPEAIYRLWENLTRNNADISLCRYVCVSEDGDELPTAESIIKDEVLTSEQALSRLTEDKAAMYVVVWNRLYKGELARSVRFPEGRIHEDEFTAHHFYAKAGRVACSTDRLYYYLQRRDSIVNREYTIRHFEGSYDAMVDRYTFLKGRKQESLARVTAFTIFYTLTEGLERLDFKENRRHITGRAWKALEISVREKTLVGVRAFCRYLKLRIGIG